MSDHLSRRPTRGDEAEAVVLDAHLDALIDAADRRAIDVPAEVSLDPALREAARRLRRDLVRVHPSFRFEERLARRLRAAAAGLDLRAAAGAEGALVPFASAGSPMRHASNDRSIPPADDIAGVRANRPGLPASGFLADLPDPAALLGGLPRPWLIGGALTSAAISLAGAYMAWRAWPGRSGGRMARAVRAVQHARVGAGELAGGAGSVLRASIGARTGAARAATAHVAAPGGSAVRRSLD